MSNILNKHTLISKQPSIIISDQWIESLGKRKKRTVGIAQRKPVRVKGPYVVHMLTDDDIIEDLGFVKQVSSI